MQLFQIVKKSLGQLLVQSHIFFQPNSLGRAQKRLTPTTAASTKNKESLKKGSPSLPFSASTSKRALSRIDEGDPGSYTVTTLGKTNLLLGKANQLQLEQPIGTRTDRLRKPTQPTGDVADKSMVQVSDLAERSTSYSGDSVAQKKQRLDLSAILAASPREVGEGHADPKDAQEPRHGD